MTSLILSCEHASNHIPQYLPNLKIPKHILESHEAYDIGAKEICLATSKALHIPCLLSETSRLAIDYNRSLHNPKIWSRYSKNLSPELKLKLESDLMAYRLEIEKKIIPNKLNIHLSIHSFTPVLRGVKRKADIGILYDSRIEKEKAIGDSLFREFVNLGFLCRKNYPYKGMSDGICSSFRKKNPHNYLGIELEINQSIILQKNIKLKIVEVLSSFYSKLEK